MPTNSSTVRSSKKCQEPLDVVCFVTRRHLLSESPPGRAMFKGRLNISVTSKERRRGVKLPEDHRRNQPINSACNRLLHRGISHTLAERRKGPHVVRDTDNVRRSSASAKRARVLSCTLRQLQFHRYRVTESATTTVSPLPSKGVSTL